jgi:hypothetical protein
MDFFEMSPSFPDKSLPQTFAIETVHNVRDVDQDNRTASDDPNLLTVEYRSRYIDCYDRYKLGASRERGSVQVLHFLIVRDDVSIDSRVAI